jgi:hypothetical protein
MLKWMLRWIVCMSKRIGIDDLVGYVYIVKVDLDLKLSYQYKCYL